MIENTIMKRGDYPIKVRLLKSDTNLGFAGGNNLLLRRFLTESSAPLVMLLNIDTQIRPDCLSRLVDAMRADESAGMIEALQEPREHPKYYDPRTFETHWCSGGGVLIRREALEEVGLFDERFFLYCEDVDLSWRMWMHGWRCKINPHAKYQHFTEAQDSGKDLSGQHYYSMRNCFYMHYKYDTASGIRQLERLFEATVAGETDPKLRQLFEKARADARRIKRKFIFDRLKLGLLPRSPWMIFDGFAFENRRRFIDHADRREILD